MDSILKWACDPSLQYEVNWLEFLSKSLLLPPDTTILVESGLLFLHRSPSSIKLRNHADARLARLSALRDKKILIFHLSDEEGYDGDWFYPNLSPNVFVWRNFPHKRFDSNPRIKSFPIGPRNIFISHSSLTKNVSLGLYGHLMAFWFTYISGIQIFKRFTGWNILWR